MRFENHLLSAIAVLKDPVEIFGCKIRIQNAINIYTYPKFKKKDDGKLDL
ncbi:MAG: hypothetical protein N3D09_00800 [Archaeoglobaceae archaeon]|nr:hypothetical protein [Archaeoglobaceae archaeon]